ncbi:MAG: DUF748 domain-containing protein, partial [Verrucomicrobiae bacterium]|nr:DUF748 domain-containing protein [Verrucomicrobiae bacterium]
IGLAIVGVIYTITGFFIIPAIARSQIEKRGSEALHRTVTLEKVRLNPFTFRVRLENLNITDTMAEKLASWSLVDVNFDPLTSLFKWQFYFKEMRLVDPKKWLHIDQEGKLNIADLVEAAESPDEQPEAVSNLQLPPIGVGLMHIEGWALDFTDDSQLSPFHSAIGPMTFDLTGFTTRPNEESPYSLEGTTEAGESFSWTGSVSAQPLGSKGKIQFSGLAIPKYAPYAEQFHNAVISTGTVACSTEYEVALGESLTMRFIDTQVAIENVQLRSKGADEPEVTLGKFAMHVNQADAMARTADVEQIEINGIKIVAERRADGTIDLLDWVKKDDDAPQPQPEASTPATEGEVAFQFPDIKVKMVSAGDATVRFTDQTTPEPAVMQVSLVSLKAENATSDLSKP